MTKEAHEHDPPITDEGKAEHAERELSARLGDEMKGLIEIVHFGHETELFLAKNRVGRFLVERAEDDLNEATRQLLDMNSLSDTKAADAHMKARTAISILRWLNEAIAAGREAELAIQGQDEIDA